MHYFKYIIILLAMIMAACTEENRIDFIPEGGDAPALVANTQVTPTIGGGVIKFDAPNDPNFLCAKAVYEIRDGFTREVKASVYTNSLVVNGYGDTHEHTIKIYSVGKNEKISEDFVSVTFTPLTPAVVSAFETLEILNGFGSIKVNYDNPSASNLIVEVYMDSTSVDSTVTNNLNLIETFYTNSAEGKFNIRGLDPEKALFAVKISDPFGNQSDIKTAMLTPLYEQMIPKDGYKDLLLLDKCEYYAANRPLSYLWNDNNTTSVSDFWASDQQGLAMPKAISIDVGQSCVLSRIKWFHRYGYEWKHSTPTKWSLYGSNYNDDSPSSWKLIQQMGPEYKPSGLPVGERTDEDIEYTRANGSSFDIENPVGPFRYYKIKFEEMGDGGSFIILKEIEFYGSFADV